MNLFGIVARHRVNDPESGRPAVEAEFVKADRQGVLMLSGEPVVEWTTIRAEAREMPWAEAEEIAANLGWPAHAITVSREPEVEVPECYREMRNSRPERRPSVTATETFERLEKQHLA